MGEPSLSCQARECNDDRLLKKIESNSEIMFQELFFAKQLRANGGVGDVQELSSVPPSSRASAVSSRRYVSGDRNPLSPEALSGTAVISPLPLRRERSMFLPIVTSPWTGKSEIVPTCRKLRLAEWDTCELRAVFGRTIRRTGSNKFDLIVSGSLLVVIPQGPT